jgi:hypothetical protein
MIITPGRLTSLFRPRSVTLATVIEALDALVTWKD